MSSRLTLSQIGARIAECLEPMLPHDDADLLVRFGSPVTIASYLDALAVEPSLLRRALEELITGFTRRQPVLVRSYMGGELPLPVLAQAVVRFLAETGTAYDCTEIMGSLIATDQRLDWAIRAHLPSQREHFTLCGYGLGNGAYEKQLAARLAGQGTSVELFGYDPNNACFDREAIQPCTLATLQTTTSPLFDMILTRWVLHHVAPDQRWEAFSACVRHCKADASVLIVEEGAFSTEKNTAVLVYEFLSSCADVLVNSVLYPDWLCLGDSPGEQFYLQYLTPADVTALEAAFPMAFRRRLEWLQAGFFPQIIIRYSFRTSVPVAV